MEAKVIKMGKAIEVEVDRTASKEDIRAAISKAVADAISEEIGG